MSDRDKIEQDRKERLAKGGFEVADGQGGGFAQHEADFENPGLAEYLRTDPQLHKELLEIEAQVHDRKPTEQHTERFLEVFEANMNSEAVRECQWLRQDEITQYVPGKMMTSTDFLLKLKKIRPDAMYAREAVLGRRALCVVNPLKHTPYFVTTVQDGMMIEWSQMRVDEHNIPTNEKFHGWRSVLMTLIEKEIITIEQSDAVFGKPTGERSNRWYRQLYILRNSRCPECLKQLCTCKTIGEGLRADKYAYKTIQ